MNIVLTGSSSGIGLALAERLLQRGHSVWGLARSDQKEMVSRYSGQFQYSRCDVGEWLRVKEVGGEIAKTWPQLDALICCAGMQGEIGRCVQADPEKWSSTVRANLDGTFNPIRALFPLLSKAPRRAKIVCFSGGGSTRARANFSAYGVAKTGVVRLVETIAEEESGSALDINAIAPGAINTRLTDEVIALGPKIAGEAEYQAALKQKAKGGASLERALDCIEWMISPASDGISGRLISAPWDPWEKLDKLRIELMKSDIYTLRRIMPEERQLKF